jgi:hypothetical protein
MEDPGPRRSGLARARRASEHRWRRATAVLRSLPDVVILGAQRGGTTSLFDWLAGHPAVAASSTKEVHYFDRYYDNGDLWYRAHFPLKLSRRLALEATPYLLFSPVAPGRVAADLPSSTRFIVLLRDPVQRAISHYWHSRRIQAEDQPLAVALAREEERLAGQGDIVLAGGESFAFRNFSYKARGHYAEQLERWFDVIDPKRFLVMESEALFGDREGPAGVLDWLGLSPQRHPFPITNEAPRAVLEDGDVVEELRRHFAPHNEALFALLGRRLWER